MEFELSDEHKALIEVAREVRPEGDRALRRRKGRKEEFSRETFDKMAELGFAGMFCPEEYGGTNVGFVGSVGVLLEVAKACGSSAGALAVHALIQEPIARHGTERKRAVSCPE